MVYGTFMVGFHNGYGYGYTLGGYGYGYGCKLGLHRSPTSLYHVRPH